MPSDSPSVFLRPYALQTWVWEDLAHGLAHGSAPDWSLSPQELAQVSLRRSRPQSPHPASPYPIRYHCGLPHRLAAQAKGATPQGVAQQMLPYLGRDRGWQTHVDDRHHWVWTATPTTLGHWLQHWLQHWFRSEQTQPSAGSAPDRPPRPALPEPPWAGDDHLLWLAQYGHGRCCQRLQQVAAEFGSVAWETANLDPAARSALTATETHTMAAPIAPLSPSQFQLLDSALQLIDALAWKPQRSPALLSAFVTALDRFQAQHPFPGFLQSQTPTPLPLIRYHLLLQLSQSLLRIVLADLWGAIAPTDL